MVKRPQNGDKSPWASREFLLILALLAALIITEGMIFWFFRYSGDRGEVLALIFGAFGAWIGAGAAYFFGRENLRVATDSMLKMRGRLPEEILAGTKLSDMDPRPFPKKFGEKETMKVVMEWFEEKEGRFFAVVVDDSGKFICAVHEEAFYRFMHDKLREAEQEEGKEGEGKKKEEKKEPVTIKTLHEKVCGTSIEDIIDYFKAQKGLQGLVEAAVKLTSDDTALAASEIMKYENKFVAVVVDDKELPTGYITTADIRHLLSISGHTESK